MQPFADICPFKTAMIARFISTDETRYYLSGVHVEPHPNTGVILVATNGHVMGVAHDPAGHVDEPVILPFNTPGTKSLLKVSKRDAVNNPRLIFEKSSEISGLVGILGTPRLVKALMPPIDGSFPDWRRVVPWHLLTNEPGVKGLYNPALLSLFADRKAPPNNPPISLHGDRMAGPVIVRRPDLPWFFGIIMPMTQDDTPLSDGILDLCPAA